MYLPICLSVSVSLLRYLSIDIEIKGEREIDRSILWPWSNSRINELAFYSLLIFYRSALKVTIHTFKWQCLSVVLDSSSPSVNVLYISEHYTETRRLHSNTVASSQNLLSWANHNPWLGLPSFLVMYALRFPHWIFQSRSYYFSILSILCYVLVSPFF